MRKFTASAAVCAVLAAAPALAQLETEGADSDVYRSDLPETHAGYDLPQVDAGSIEAGEADVKTLATHSTAAQQMGNLIASKFTSGVARDLGDTMILLHDGVLRRIVSDQDVEVPQDARDALAELETLNRLLKNSSLDAVRGT